MDRLAVFQKSKQFLYKPGPAVRFGNGKAVAILIGGAGTGIPELG